MSESLNIASAATCGSQNVRWLIDGATSRLAAAGVPSARLDAEVLLANVLGTERSGLHARPLQIISERDAAAFEVLLQRRLEREPLAYITGVKEFWSLDFEVTRDVLIPRPETECLVEAALRFLRGSGSEPSVCEIGTGSGCIAVALARDSASAKLVAADVSLAALDVAQRNAARHRVGSRIEFIRSDLFSALNGRRFDLIVSNPPYVAAGEIATLEPELRCEPELALNGGGDGLEVIRRLLAEAAGYLVPRGELLVEIGSTSADIVADLARARGFEEVAVLADCAGLPRVLVARAG